MIVLPRNFLWVLNLIRMGDPLASHSIFIHRHRRAGDLTIDGNDRQKLNSKVVLKFSLHRHRTPQMKQNTKPLIRDPLIFGRERSQIRWIAMTAWNMVYYQIAITGCLLFICITRLFLWGPNGYQVDGQQRAARFLGRAKTQISIICHIYFVP